MKHLKQNGPYCLVYSAAMVLDVWPSEIHESIGHDGTAEVFDSKNKTNRMRGVHICEILDFARTMGNFFSFVEYDPCISQRDGCDVHHVIPKHERHKRFLNHIWGNRAILIGSLPTGAGHAVAWDGRIVYDPRGGIYMLSSDSFIPIYAFVRII